MGNQEKLPLFGFQAGQCGENFTNHRWPENFWMLDSRLSRRCVFTRNHLFASRSESGKIETRLTTENDAAQLSPPRFGHRRWTADFQQRVVNIEYDSPDVHDS
jgi:hypothetical protein